MTIYSYSISEIREEGQIFYDFVKPGISSADGFHLRRFLLEVPSSSTIIHNPAALVTNLPTTPTYTKLPKELKRLIQ